MNVFFWDIESGAVFSVLSLMLLAGGTIVYLRAAYIERRTEGHDRWSGWRVFAFGTGAVLLGIAVSPPLVEWAHQDLRGHMVQHLLIGMLAPLALVLSAPVTLFLRRLSVPTARRVTAVLRSGLARVLTHPAAALLINVGGMYVLYGTSLYVASLHSPLLHALIHVHFWAAGYLFCWATLAGPDPAPHPPSPGLRLGVLFVSMASHAILGKLMYWLVWPPGTPYSTEEIRAAAQLMYYGGDMAEVLLAVALFWRWYRTSASRRGEFLSGLLWQQSPRH